MSRVPSNDSDTTTNDAANEGAGAGAGNVSDTEYRRLKQAHDDLFDRLARVTADFQNSRRRLEAETEQRLQFANSALIKAMIPVIDNFERALSVDNAKADAATILKGLQMVHDQWMAVLIKEHVETIDPKVGTAFDPTRHEALIQQPSDQYKDPTVLQTLTKGYALHGRTLRPASVIVSRPA